MKRTEQTKRIRLPQKRGQQTRENLVLAGIQALTQTNVYSLRISHVTKVAGVAQPLFDYHFQGLDDLLMAMVMYQLQRVKIAATAAIESNSTNPRKALEAYIQVYYDLGDADHGFRAVWSGYYHLTQTNKAFADLNRVVRETGRDRIVMLVQAILAREGRKIKQPGITTLYVANAIQSMITGGTFIAGAETGGDFKVMGETNIRAANDLIDFNFPKE